MPVYSVTDFHCFDSVLTLQCKKNSKPVFCHRLSFAIVDQFAGFQKAGYLISLSEGRCQREERIEIWTLESGVLQMQ